MALHADVDVSDAKIPFLQFPRRFTPRGNAHLRWQTGLRRLRTALNPVIGKNSVSPILGIASRHVAAQTVSIPAGMRSREVCCVAGEAARAVILDGL